MATRLTPFSRLLIVVLILAAIIFGGRYLINKGTFGDIMNSDKKKAKELKTVLDKDQYKEYSKWLKEENEKRKVEIASIDAKEKAAKAELKATKAKEKAEKAREKAEKARDKANKAVNKHLEAR